MNAELTLLRVQTGILQSRYVDTDVLNRFRVRQVELGNRRGIGIAEV